MSMRSLSPGNRTQSRAYSAYHLREIPEPDAELTHTGPGTPMGEYMRLFWQPVCLSQELGDLPKAITIMGEKLVAFRDRGGRAIVWHGWADQLITAPGSVDYYERVERRMGGPRKTSEFIRLFMAPGVMHCAGGAGPQPTGLMEGLLAWVEEGKAPESLLATRRDQTGAVTRSRPLCHGRSP